MAYIYAPIDFNSLSTLDGNRIKLSDYYIDYAFTSEGIEPQDGLEIVFYDKYWTQDPDEIVCLDAVLKNTKDSVEPWYAEVKGSVYAYKFIPKRKLYSSFVGANTFLLDNGKKANIQKLGPEFGKDQLGGVSCFMFGPGSELPNFSSIVGMDVDKLHQFFQFKDLNIKAPTTLPDGNVADDTLVIRGGGNVNETYDLHELKDLQRNIRSIETWSGVTKELAKKNIDSNKIIVAASFPEDSCQQYWAIVTFDKQIYEFYYDWLHKDPSEGIIVEWNDFTNDSKKVYLHENVENVLKYFDELVATLTN
jgi:hypothetical protein